jgi:hypothetical protein
LWISCKPQDSNNGGGSKYEISRTTNTETGILTNQGDVISLYVESKTDTPTTWFRDGTKIIGSEQPVEGIIYNTSVIDTLTLTLVDESAAFHENGLLIEATDGVNNTSVTVVVGKIESKPVLFSTDYFELRQQEQPGDTVVGFSQAVKNNPQLLINAEFNALDFSKQNKIKFIDGNCQFDKSVFEV